MRFTHEDFVPLLAIIGGAAIGVLIHTALVLVPGSLPIAAVPDDLGPEVPQVGPRLPPLPVWSADGRSVTFRSSGIESASETIRPSDSGNAFEAGGEYYLHVIRQVNICFRAIGDDGLRATVFFRVERGGSITDLELVSSSGNKQFDQQVIGAVDCVSQGRLNRLPEGLPGETLPIRFEFRPRARWTHH